MIFKKIDLNDLKKELDQAKKEWEHEIDEKYSKICKNIIKGYYDYNDFYNRVIQVMPLLGETSREKKLKNDLIYLLEKFFINYENKLDDLGKNPRASE